MAPGYFLSITENGIGRTGGLRLCVHSLWNGLKTPITPTSADFHLSPSAHTRGKSRSVKNKDEYEFAYSIPSSHVHAFLELLGASEVKDVLGALKHFGGPRYSEISAALKQATASMPIQFWSSF